MGVLYLRHQNPPISNRVLCSMSSFSIRNRCAKKILETIDANKSPGPDGIPPIVIKKCAASIAGPFRHLLHTSFSTGIFPDSNKYTINAGVPQGSMLSPTLFLMFIDNLLKITINPIHSFADDSTLHASFRCNNNSGRSDIDLRRQNINSSLNLDLKNILDWGSRNMANFNSKKTQLCCFSNKRSVSRISIRFGNYDLLTRQNSLSLLGFNLSEHFL